MPVMVELPHAGCGGAFVNIPHMPSKQAVLNKFCQDDVLQHILAVKGEVRCYEIVKNYFRRGQASLMLLISPTLYVNIHQSIYLFICTETFT